MTASERNSRVSRWIAARANSVIAASLLITALLAVPFLTMQPDESASQEPAGAVFDARDKIEDEFASSVFSTFLVVEDRDGDLLTADSLRALLAAEESLRNHPELGPTLFTYFDTDELTEVVGIQSIADLVDRRLPGGLANATDESIKQVVGGLIAERGPTELGLSAQTELDADGQPVSPAILVPVLSDDTVLGFGAGGVRLGTDTAPEEYSREVLEVIRAGETSYQAWGVAIDVNLTAAEQGEVAGPFIGFTILAVLLIVGLTFRSYWVLAVTGAALSALIIWLQGISNLIGFKDDLILSLIVPIAMISFGVDFAFHAVGRYKEQRLAGYTPRRAFGTGIAAVSGALVLALASDSAAFLSNSSAGIESIVQFGIGAAVALVAAFLLLGIVTPLAVMKIEDKVGLPIQTRTRRFLAINGAGFAAAAAMTSVLLSVFILPVGGLIALATYIVVFLLLPYRFAAAGAENVEIPQAEPGRGTKLIGEVITRITRMRRIVLPAVAVITVIAVSFMVRVESEFDVKDFFSADTDFVVSLDKLDEHGGEQAGEPADILVDADLTDPAALQATARFAAAVRSLDSDRFARTDEGTIDLQGGVLDVIDEVWQSDVALAAAPVPLTDNDADGLPDTTEQLTALYAFTRQAGVPFDAQNVTLTPDNVRTVLSADSATRMQLQIPGSREVATISAAKDTLQPLVAQLESDLQAIDAESAVTLTGGPIVRQESLDGVQRALQISLPIAVVLCLIIASVFMRSVRYGIVSVIPILIVVSWLYAFMYLFGYSINLVTATIGAVSIGIGIDFAIHFAMRYREELGRTGSRDEAVRSAGEGTGVALVASAVSSMIGFAILAFAPMPLFASYGFLTAIMIGMAGAASLLVLPSLLMAITKDRPHVSGGLTNEAEEAAA
ncbi:MAG: efflux RND transporter permease subunit [Acidimicrobiia bacterium]|nr:efflux RND transporter permease subunit [Acidimicrobiia bacterium]